VLEDGAENSREGKQMNQLVARQMKFIQQPENAQVRIKTVSLMACIGTGKLIPKERSAGRAPHPALDRSQNEAARLIIRSDS
jgi:RNA polymerase-binding transcription factor DksA